MATFEELLERWDGEQAVINRDRESGGWIFICMHSTRLGAGDPGPFTARGVFHGIQACLAHVYGSPDLAGRTVLVQGAGSVGASLIALLREAGASVLVTDVDAGRAEAVGGTVVDPADAIGTECDVYAPCALGATLSAESVPRLRCRVVAGSANNQLAEPGAAELLQETGILYAPDFVINAGGAIAINYLELNNRTQADVDDGPERIGETLTEIYARAEGDGITTASAADTLAASRLS